MKLLAKMSKSPMGPWAPLPIGPMAHRPHCPCAPLAMWPIAHVAHTPCTPYPLCPIAHVAHTLYPIPAVGLIGHVPHIPCTPLSPVSTLPIGPVAHVAHYPMGGQGDGCTWGNSVQGVEATWAMGPMDNGGTGDIGYRGMGNGVQGYGAYAHVPHWPCDLLPMWPIPLVPHTPCYCPCGPYPVPHTRCGPHWPCAPYPLYPFVPCLYIAHRPCCPCGPLPNGGGQGDGAHGAIVYRG